MNSRTSSSRAWSGRAPASDAFARLLEDSIYALRGCMNVSAVEHALRVAEEIHDDDSEILLGEVVIEHDLVLELSIRVTEREPEVEDDTAFDHDDKAVVVCPGCQDRTSLDGRCAGSDGSVAGLADLPTFPLRYHRTRLRRLSRFMKQNTFTSWAARAPRSSNA